MDGKYMHNMTHKNSCDECSTNYYPSESIILLCNILLFITNITILAMIKTNKKNNKNNRLSKK